MRDLIRNYERLPTSFKERLPVFKYDMINIQAQGEEEIKLYEPITRIVVRSFKYIFYNVDQLMESFLISVDELSKHTTDEEIQKIVELLLIYYYGANRDFKKEKLIEKIRDLDGKGEQVMTILQRSEQKGLKKGLERGRKEVAKNLLQEKMSYELISRTTGLTVEEVKEIEKKIK